MWRQNVRLATRMGAAFHLLRHGPCFRGRPHVLQRPGGPSVSVASSRNTEPSCSSWVECSVGRVREATTPERLRSSGTQVGVSAPVSARLRHGPPSGHAARCGRAEHLVPPSRRPQLGRLDARVERASATRPGWNRDACRTRIDQHVGRHKGQPPRVRRARERVRRQRPPRSR